MPLKDILLDGERIEYSTKPEAKFGSIRNYQLVMTNQRLILYAEKGRLQTENIISRNLSEISEITYSEFGTFSKKPNIVIKSQQFPLAIEMKNAKQVTKILQQYLKSKKGTETGQISCKYCGQVMPQTTLFCPNCGAGVKR